MHDSSVNEMSRAADILSEAMRLIPSGPWHCQPLGTRQYPQRVTSSRGALVAECYENARDIRIGPYLTLMTPEVTETITGWLGRKGTEWDEAVEWKDGCYIHVGGCTGIVGRDTRADGCDCFDDALETARAVLRQVAAAGEWSR